MGRRASGRVPRLPEDWHPGRKRRRPPAGGATETGRAGTQTDFGEQGVEAWSQAPAPDDPRPGPTPNSRRAGQTRRRRPSGRSEGRRRKGQNGLGHKDANGVGGRPRVRREAGGQETRVSWGPGRVRRPGRPGGPAQKDRDAGGPVATLVRLPPLCAPRPAQGPRQERHVGHGPSGRQGGVLVSFRPLPRRRRPLFRRGPASSFLRPRLASGATPTEEGRRGPAPRPTPPRVGSLPPAPPVRTRAPEAEEDE